MPASTLPKPRVFERGDKVYFVTQVAPFAPEANEIEEFAFAQDLQKIAPNPAIKWMRGQYVEADNANQNGALWREGELALKHLTPMFMPVTVMHDFRSAVGVIADTKLLTPDADQVARARIETKLGLWEHRFPDVVEEAMHNATEGTLMQSMECVSPDYSCSECGQQFHKLPHGAEQASWCAHLKGEGGTQAARILGNVIFTGTGLIFGTRGAKGAYSEAHLEVFQEEVAEFHERTHRATRKTPAKRRTRSHMEMTEIAVSERDRIIKERDDAQAEVASLKEKVADAEKATETAEAAKVKAEEERDQAKTKLTDAEEKAREVELRDERMKTLGKGFVAKLGDTTKTRLTEQAGTMKDDEWSARLDEVEELVKVKRDDKGEGGEGEGEDAEEKASLFSQEEVARSTAGGGKGEPGEADQSAASRSSVIGGLSGLTKTKK